MRHDHTHLHLRLRLRTISALIGSLFGSAALLSACGGSADSPAGPTVLPATTVAQVVRVVDGPIKGALVCLDKNDNGVCETDEIQGITTDDGSVTLQVPSANFRKYPVLALVGGPDAVDKVNGQVTTAYVLKAPADQPAVVSPLTTLVVAQMDAAGGSSADAERALQDKLGISSSLFADLSKQTDAPSQYAATVSRLLVLTAQQQARDTTGASDSKGQPLFASDLATAQRNSLLTVLPTLVAAATDPALVAAKDADKEAALKAAALGISAAAGLTAANVGAVVAQAKLPPAADSSSEVPTAGTSLRWFSYAGAGNYSLRMYKSSAAQNTVLNGKRQFTEYREQSSASNGNVTFYQQWGEGLNNWARNQTVWTGSAWFDCPTDQVHEATPWDAMGQSDSLYCKAFKTRSKRTERNLENVVMADLVKEIRAYPLVDSAGKFSAWGPDPVANAAALAGVFPAGSKLYHHTGSDTANPDTYNTTAGDVYMPYTAAVAGGVVAECNKVTGSNSVLFRSEAATLEAMVAGARGQPCVYGVGNNTGEDKNEWWGNSTFDIGDVSTPYANSTGFYKVGLKDLRASIGAGNGVNFWLCLRRSSDNSPRNCTPAGTGSYSIDETLGDARVLRLAGLPAIAGNLSYQRIMVQRGGKVYYGSRSKLALTHQVRLNGSASQALFTALGMPAPQAAPAKLTPTLLLDRYIGSGGAGTLNRNSLALLDNDPASLVGAWALDSATNPRTEVFVFFADGQYVMADPQGDTQPSLCGGPGIELGTYSFDKAAGRLRFLSNARDTNGCAGAHDTSDNSFGAPGVVLSADGKTAAVTFTDNSGGATFYRLTK